MKRFVITALLLITVLPTLAVFDEDSIVVTLSQLRLELANEYNKVSNRSSMLESRRDHEQSSMTDILRRCNELSLILYSQNPEWTLASTYAFKEVTKQYMELTQKNLPYQEIIAYLDGEIVRYSRLVESLRRLPPQLKPIEDIPDTLLYRNDSLIFSKQQRDNLLLDQRSRTERDSCFFYALSILKAYISAKEDVMVNSENYMDASVRLKESYDYVQERFLQMQDVIFKSQTDNYVSFLIKLPQNFTSISTDFKDKIAMLSDTRSDWRGTIIITFLTFAFAILFFCLGIGMVVSYLIGRRTSSIYFKANRRYVATVLGLFLYILATLFPRTVTQYAFVKMVCEMMTVYFWLVIVTVSSITVMKWKESPAPLMKFYIPILILAFIILLCRMLFLPNSILHLIFLPLLLVTLIWQIVIFRKVADKIGRLNANIARGTIVAVAVSTILSFLGFNLLSLIFTMWITFQIAILQSLFLFKSGVKYFSEKYRNKYRVAHLSTESVSNDVTLKSFKGEIINKTWFFDYLEMALIPSLGVFLFIQCIWASLSIFDMNDLFNLFINYPLIEYSFIHVSVRMLVVASVMFFHFRFLTYLLRSFTRVWKIERFKKESGQKIVHLTDVNLTLSDNVVGIAIWGCYIISIFILFKIPTDAIAMISTGLAAGLGMAMKDIVNNFIYGIQLMSGRLRPGDWIECDGVRGKVMEIKYQCTQLETLDGAVMSFLNTDLLAKNFKNLTRNDRYECLEVKVGVSYGTDVERVRKLLKEGLVRLQTKDDLGQDIVDPKRGTDIFFDNFDDSSVNISIQQYVLVSQIIIGRYQSDLKELIYNILNENGIEMPFPQRDIHIISYTK